MKKFLALTLTGALALASAVSLSACNAEPEINLYVVPGIYYNSDGEKTANTVPSGATPLTEEACAKINTENAYICTLPEGEDLPVPVSERVDSDGNAYTFNGWWTIVDATVTYFDTVPKIKETTFLYADWRADLSQRKDPVESDESNTVQPRYYMSIERAATETTETVTLLVSGTDVPNAEKLGYSSPVQLYNEWFELNEGDKISVYTAGLGSDEAQFAPVEVTGKEKIVNLESSSDEGNDTRDYLEKNEDYTVTYKTGLPSKHFRIYIKFYDGGATMNIYMQPME